MTDNLLENEDQIQSGQENIVVEVQPKDGRPEGLPEKFWDAENQQVRTESLVQSYKELERKLSSMLPRPETDEDKIRVFKALGMPEAPEQYEIDTNHGLFEADPELNQKMFEHGFTAHQAQAVYDLAAEKFVPLVFEIAQEFQADREVERLTAAFGGEEKWQEVSRQLLAFGKKNLPDDVLGSLSSSFEGVMALHRMMKGDEPSLRTPDAAQAGEGDGGEDGLKSMMRDPRYWRDKDPAFVSQVTKGFERLYSK